ncbi:hypothetical protein EDB81DRAFT_275127 [Dactylonectria macrodidyma]|uniref:Uncharacterized protein n=1 Tax=Dactylonectria macrodidyma TaxID=307937 RepID=A0A9P9FLE6_9HYPO|nr:hypothetical protein EDB81DRAFT_275127 [Dactylonectria macrodidyma]
MHVLAGPCDRASPSVCSPSLHDPPTPPLYSNAATWQSLQGRPRSFRHSRGADAARAKRPTHLSSSPCIAPLLLTVLSSAPNWKCVSSASPTCVDCYEHASTIIPAASAPPNVSPRRHSRCKRPLLSRAYHFGIAVICCSSFISTPAFLLAQM